MTTTGSGTVVDRLYAEFAALDVLLREHSEASLVITADDCFRKVLLLSAASHFETAIVTAIEQFVESTAQGNDRVIEFVRRKALERQYHTLFDWKASNANKFYSYFGERFKRAMEVRFTDDAGFAASVSAFLELGRDRNRMVHEDFGQFVLEKTAEEIYALFQQARLFVEGLPNDLERADARAG